jgi:hypothetical protein
MRTAAAGRAVAVLLVVDAATGPACDACAVGRGEDFTRGALRVAAGDGELADSTADSEESAAATATEPNSEPTPRATARAPTRPT